MSFDIRAKKISSSTKVSQDTSFVKNPVLSLENKQIITFQIQGAVDILELLTKSIHESKDLKESIIMNMYIRHACWHLFHAYTDRYKTPSDYRTEPKDDFMKNGQPPQEFLDEWFIDVSPLSISKQDNISKGTLNADEIEKIQGSEVPLLRQDQSEFDPDYQPINKETVLFYIGKVIESLQAFKQIVEGNKTEDESNYISSAIRDACAHLFRAYNGRFRSIAEINNLPENEHRKMGQPPREFLEEAFM